jgi:ABC-type multidrug transport system ATPase subunit
MEVNVMQNAIEVKNLRKCYKDIQAVKGIDFSVEKGSFFALLGVNGAGKTTTIQIIATLLKKTSGEVIVNGHRIDIEDHLIRKDIGVVFQGSMLDKYLTVKENIINRGPLYGLSVNEAKSGGLIF